MRLVLASNLGASAWPGSQRCTLALLIVIATLLAFGCDERADAPPPVVVTEESEPAPTWQVLDDSMVAVLDPDAIDDELQAAMDVARAAAAQAREDWQYSTPEQKKRWAIKWAAPTADDRVEFVWVRPVTWSANRIEGVLANAPHNELACEKTKGEYVGFPAEELADWIHYRSGDLTGPYEGGFTQGILIKRFGSPATAP